MLSWGYYTLMQDGRSLSDLKQGVTLEVFGEGTSPGPRGSIENNNFVGFGEAMEDLEISGVSTNIASFLGAATVRIQEIGFANRKATQDEMDSMKTPSYPSGHSVQGILIAKVLGKKHPKAKSAFTKTGENISYSRRVARAHYKSDSKVGEDIGNSMFKHIKNKI